MNNGRPMHGTAKAIGCNHLHLGNFGRLLNIPMTWADDFGIEDLHGAEEIAAALGGLNGVMHDVEDASGDSVMPAAYPMKQIQRAMNIKISNWVRFWRE